MMFVQQGRRDSEAELRLPGSRPSQLLAVCDPRGLVRYVNPSARRVLGIADEAELLGRNALSLVHADDRSAVRLAFAAWMSHRPDSGGVRCRVIHSDGSWHVIESFGCRDDSASGGGNVAVTSRECVG